MTTARELLDLIEKNQFSEAIPSSNKLATALLAFIKEQIKLDLTPFVHEKQQHPRMYLGVDISYRMDAKEEDKRKVWALEKLQDEYGGGFFKVGDNGGFGITLRYGPKLTNDSEMQKASRAAS
jgi:hypothetical protein